MSYLVSAVPDDFVIPDHLLGPVTRATQIAMSQPDWGPPPELIALAEHRGITIEEASRLQLAHIIERSRTERPKKEGA